MKINWNPKKGHKTELLRRTIANALNTFAKDSMVKEVGVKVWEVELAIDLLSDSFSYIQEGLRKTLAKAGFRVQHTKRIVEKSRTKMIIYEE